MSNTIPSTNELSKKKELNLWNKQFVKNSHVCSIAESLKTNTSLTFLGFRECKGVSDNGVIAIANVVGSTNLTLKKLNFENTMVGDQGIIALAEALPSSGLIRLDLAYIKITDNGGLALANALSNGVPIVTLALDHCALLTDISGLAFLAAMEHNTSIMNLGLKGTGVSRECRVKVDTALVKNEKLSKQRK